MFAVLWILTPPRALWSWLSTFRLEPRSCLETCWQLQTGSTDMKMYLHVLPRPGWTISRSVSQSVRLEVKGFVFRQREPFEAWLNTVWLLNPCFHLSWLGGWNRANMTATVSESNALSCLDCTYSRQPGLHLTAHSRGMSLLSISSPCVHVFMCVCEKGLGPVIS